MDGNGEYRSSAFEKNGNRQLNGLTTLSPPVISTIAILPGDPPLPCPELLTAIEAVRYLRLDVNGPDRPEQTLRRYREIGLLRGTQVGRRILYRRVELEKFLEKKTENGQESC